MVFNLRNIDWRVMRLEGVARDKVILVLQNESLFFTDSPGKTYPLKSYNSL